MLNSLGSWMTSLVSIPGESRGNGLMKMMVNLHVCQFFICLFHWMYFAIYPFLIILTCDDIYQIILYQGISLFPSNSAVTSCNTGSLED